MNPLENPLETPLKNQLDNAIDTALVIQHVRAVGANLKAQFHALAPVIEVNDMFAAFRRIDGAASQDLKQRLAALYPAVAWLDGEIDEDEAVLHAARGDYWICDAIDGAVQYLRAIPNWCTALTLLRDGQAVLVVIYDAMHDEMFHALAGDGPGAGSYLNGAAIRVNQRSTHHQGMLATSHPPFAFKYPRALGDAGKMLTATLASAFAVRNLGPTALQLAYVACGRLDVFWEFGPDGLNCYEPALLIRLAGGTVTAADGSPYGIDADGIIAAPPGAHASMLLQMNDTLD